MDNLLLEINNKFLDFNQQNRKNIISNSPVIILFINDTLYTYLYGKQVLINKLNLETYHTLKSLTHYFVYRCMRPDNIDQQIDTKIDKFLNDTIIKHNDTNISKILRKMYHTNNHETNNMENYKVLLKVCAELYSSELHNTVQLIKNLLINETEQTSLDEWNKIIICVSGPPSPRPGHSAMQYFQRLVGSNNEDARFGHCIDACEIITKKERKLYYIENVYNCDHVLEIMAQLQVERKHFDNIIPMDTDILAYDTQAYLKDVCKK
jgi:hypothetical protein